MKIKKLLWIILGFIGLGIGAVGAVLPMLPNVIKIREYEFMNRYQNLAYLFFFL